MGFAPLGKLDKILNVIVFHGFHLIFHGLNSLMRIRTLFDLSKISWNIFQSNIKLMFLEIDDIIMQNRTSPFSRGSSQ